MNASEKKVRLTPIVEKMRNQPLVVQACCRWHVEAPVRRVDQMEDGLTARDELKFFIGVVIKKNLEVNNLSIEIIYDKILWHPLIRSM